MKAVEKEIEVIKFEYYLEKEEKLKRRRLRKCLMIRKIFKLN
jgi:hypothetical protein